MVEGVGDVQVALAVEGHAMRGIELARLGPLLAEPPQELPFNAELLHSPAHGTDPDPILLVHADKDRPWDRARKEGQFRASRQSHLVQPPWLVARGAHR